MDVKRHTSIQYHTKGTEYPPKTLESIKLIDQLIYKLYQLNLDL